MPKREPRQLSQVEQDVLAEIRHRRSLPIDDPEREPLNDPVSYVYRLIDAKAANVQLGIRHIVPALGVSLRTLERRFRVRYKKSLRQHIVDIRLERACQGLNMAPIERISAIARSLGYTDIRNFNRFFSDHTRMSPTEWRAREQARTESDGSESDADEDDLAGK